MKRSFRVATVFTGAAAAVALTPALNAVAMPGNVAQVPKGQEVTPNITVENCNSGTRQWLHLYYTAAEHHGPSCFGHPGSYTIPNSRTAFASLCAGNNNGFLLGITRSGFFESVPFGPPDARLLLNGMTDVTVTLTGGQSDSNTCPQ
jgi:hypothetical protein